MKINVSFTTFPERDKFVPIMLENFAKQTQKPDRIILFLSKEEYSGIIPDHIQKCIDKGWLTEVKWVDKNIRAHKKEEIFKYYPEDYNCLIDDDLLYPKNYLADLVKFAQKDPKSVAMYAAYSYVYSDHEMVRDSNRIYSAPSFNNGLLSGLACFPPNTFPMESYLYSSLRDTYVDSCDESWITPWLIKHGTKFRTMHNWAYFRNYKVIQPIKNSNIKTLYEENKQATNNISKRITNFCNAVLIANAENEVKKIFPKLNVAKCASPQLKKEIETGVSVCLTAFNTADYVLDCLDSVQKQTWFANHDNYEIILVIDHCDKTLNKVAPVIKKYKHLRVFMLDKNSGTYIATNTAMKNARFNNLIRFDSDDLMKPNMVEKIMTSGIKFDILRFKLQNFGSNNSVQNATGQICIKKNIFEKFGGYRPWICGADSELLTRLRRFVKLDIIEDVVMMRRVHNESLTRSAKTNFKSKIREKYANFIESEGKRLKKENDAIILCSTERFKEIFSEKDIKDKTAAVPKNFVQKANFHPLA